MNSCYVPLIVQRAFEKRGINNCLFSIADEKGLGRELTAGSLKF